VESHAESTDKNSQDFWYKLYLFVTIVEKRRRYFWLFSYFTVLIFEQGFEASLSLRLSVLFWRWVVKCLPWPRLKLNILVQLKLLNSTFQVLVQLRFSLVILTMSWSQYVSLRNTCWFRTKFVSLNKFGINFHSLDHLLHSIKIKNLFHA